MGIIHTSPSGNRDQIWPDQTPGQQFVSDYVKMYNGIVTNLNNQLERNKDYVPSSKAQDLLDDILVSLRKWTSDVKSHKEFEYEDGLLLRHGFFKVQDVNKWFDEISISAVIKCSTFMDRLLEVRERIINIECEECRLQNRIVMMLTDLKPRANDLLEELGGERIEGKHWDFAQA